VTPGSRKSEGQVVRRFLTRGSPMQRMTPIEPTGDDHSPTYPLRQIVDTAQPQRKQPMEPWGGTRVEADDKLVPCHTGCLEGVGRLEIGRDATPRHGLRICLPPAAPGTSANSRTRVVETVRPYAASLGISAA
jgi:hypothetical protein